jgi:ABC-type amino acid transport substrate-binding protein
MSEKRCLVFKLRFVMQLMLLSYVFVSEASAVDHPAKGPAVLHAGTLTACVYTGFEPILYRTPQGFAGSDITLLQGFAAREGFALHYKEVPFRDIWLRPGDNECDVAAGGLGETVGRDSPGVAWSKPYYSMKRSLLIRAGDASRFKSISDFSAKRIGFVEGSTAQFDLEARHYPKTIQIGYRTIAEGMSALFAGRIDAFAVGDASAAFLGKQQPALGVIDIHRPGEMELLAFPTRAQSGIVGRLNDYINGYIREVGGALGADAR